MKLHTLWKQWDDGEIELVFALDEHTVEQNWEAWQKGVDEVCKRYGIPESDMRTVIVTINETQVAATFEAPTIPGTIGESTS